VSTDHGAGSYWDRRREVNRDRLRGIALELFVRNGYPNVSVDAIATAAGVSARTFHRYFPSKQDVLLQYRAEMDRNFIDRLDRLSPASSSSPLPDIGRIFIELTEESRDLAPFMLWRRAMATAPDVEARASGEGRRRVMVALRRVFAEWLGVDPDVDVRPDSMSAAILGVNAVAVERFVESRGTLDLVALLTEAFEFLDGGLRNYSTTSVAPIKRGPSQKRPRRPVAVL
jgi:AcrR family transcriptional regulator